MSAYWFVRRLFTSAMVLLTAVVINFAIPRLMPGSPVDRIAGGVKLSAEARDALIARFGLDGSIWEQFWRYISHAVRGDFGLSFTYYPEPVSHAIGEALPWTLLVLVTSLVLQVVIGYLLGATAAWRAGSRTDSFLQTASMVVLSVPLFWVAMVMFYIFSFKLGWFPFGGAYTIGASYDGFLDRLSDVARHAVLPIASLTIAQYATFQIILRNTMVSVIRSPFMLTAESKGISEGRLKHRHAARNALLPMVTFLGLSLAMIVGGSVYIESVFSYPGIGKLIFDSVLSRDYPVLQGCFFVFALLVVVGNFAVDVVYLYLDPRIRLQ
ncbi:MAG: ABC transporter permease [Thermoleophilia bacterium]